MKKFMLVLTVAAVLFGAFALTGCNGKNATESYRNVYLVSAIAGANYLQQSADASDFYAGVSADGSYFASARVGASGCTLRTRKTLPAKRRADRRKSRGTWILSIVTSICSTG